MLANEYDIKFGNYKHYIIPNYNYRGIQPISNQNQLSNYIDIQAMKNMSKNFDFSFLNFSLDNKENLYYNLPKNHHHWTTDFVFNVVLPIIFKNLNIEFNKSNFYEIENFVGKKSLSFHKMYDFQDDFQLLDFTDNKLYTGSHIGTLRKLENKNINAYHALFRLSHRCGLIQNNNSITERKLLINCDSMSVPIIPILAYYFNEILVLDNRSNMTFHDKIENFKFTDYICILINQNFKSYKFLSNLK